MQHVPKRAPKGKERLIKHWQFHAHGNKTEGLETVHYSRDRKFARDVVIIT